MKNKAKSPAKKNVKAPAKKETKSSAKRRTVKSAVKKKAKGAAVGKAKQLNGNKGKKPAKKITKSITNQPAAFPIITHAADQHFIPAHSNHVSVIIHDSKKAEQFFHNKEEVSIHQENQKVKAGMASRMGRKRIFNIPRKG